MDKTALEIRDLVIEYRPMREISIVKSFLRKKDGEKIIRAIDGISFTVNSGKILGVIGKNGSGKSTLLKALAGIFQPDEGYIDLKGNTVSLMSIGVGFNDLLPGRDNIILSGMLLGLSEQEMLERIDEIVEYAELGEFIDLPVRTYSSGMYSKLAFAITANLETDIILIDEVLSVGDEAFRIKSLNRMQELISDESKTVIIVSHDLVTLQNICDEVVWINAGRIMEMGSPSKVITNYQTYEG